MHLVFDSSCRREVPRVTTTLVYAAGNPLRGDDGVGAAVVEELRRCIEDPDVELVDGGTSGLEAALVFRNRRRIIIVDAADLGAAPGTVRKFVLYPSELESRPVHPNSLHAAGLFDALALAAVLDTLPREITLFGVQPRSLDYEAGLSDEVRVAVAGLVELVSRAISAPH